MKKIAIYLMTTVITVNMMCMAISPTVALAMEENTEKTTVTVDISEMVFQSGGFRIPIEENAIMLFTLDDNFQLKNDILAALKEEKDELDISEYNFSWEEQTQISIWVADIINDYPELFYVESSLGYAGSAYRIESIRFYYGGFSNEQKEAFVAKLEQAKMMITSDMTEAEKALVMHDYLAQHCVYTFDGENIYNAYGALAEGKAVCEGYALAYNTLLRTVGISSNLCRSILMDHVWNLVLIDGEWYHVDVTWDDDNSTQGYVGHNDFLLSDTEIGKNHSDWGDADNTVCTSTKYDATDYWWRNVRSQIIFENGMQYYLENGLGTYIRLMEKDGDNISLKYSHEGSLYWGNNSYLSRFGEYVYFNDIYNLYAMSVNDFVPQIVYTCEEEDGYIYGAMVYEDGYARLNITESGVYDYNDYIVIDLREKMPIQKNTISGAVVCFGDENAQILLQLVDDSGSVICVKEAAGNNTEYTLESVKDGNYTLKVNKENHVARKYPIAMSGKDLKQDVAIWLMGDVTGDGTINARDKKLIYNHMAGTSILTDYTFLVGDVTNDGVINARDKKLIYNHISGTSSLWE